jgi:peptide/nickel transport system permease protein
MVIKPKVGFNETPIRISDTQLFIRVFFSRKIVLIGFVFIITFIILAIFAPFIAPYDPNEINLDNILASPSNTHLLGTDASGRDLLSRIIFGTRISLAVGVVSTLISAFIGMPLGLVAGYFGGTRQTVIMRFIDALMSIPPILLALIIASMLGGGLLNVMIAIGVGMIPAHCRLMCGQVLSVRENEYVLSLKVIGAGNLRIMLKHLFPNCLSPLIILLTIELGQAILAEAGLSFLGIGIEHGIPAWGGMVSGGSKYLASHPLISIAPGMAVMLLVFSMNMVGDGLRDALDPRLRGII